MKHIRASSMIYGLPVATSNACARALSSTSNQPALRCFSFSLSLRIFFPALHTHTHRTTADAFDMSALPLRVMYMHIFPSSVCCIIRTRRYPLLKDHSPNSRTYLYCLSGFLFLPILGQPIYLTCSRNFTLPFRSLILWTFAGCTCDFSPSPIWIIIIIITVLWLLFYYCIMPVGLLAITVFLQRVDAPLQIGKISILADAHACDKQ